MTAANTPQNAMPAISKCSSIKFLWAANKCYALSLPLSGTASAVGPLAVTLMKPITLTILFLITFNQYINGQEMSNLETTANSEIDSLFSNFKPKYKSITFGYFAMGEVGIANIFFKIDLVRKKIYIDSTRNFRFSINRQIEPKNFTKEIIANELIKKFLIAFSNIPANIKSMNYGENIVGCPDCQDGGGIYIELEVTSRKKQLFAQIIRGSFVAREIFVEKIYNMLREIAI